MDTSNSVFVTIDDEVDTFNNEYKICALQNCIALLFAASNAMLNFMVLAIVHERVPREGRLPDISFDILPSASWALDISEYIISVQGFIVLILLFLHRYRIILFRRLCIMMGVIYFARAICMSSTQVPVTIGNYCAPPMPLEISQYWSSYIAEIFKRVFHMMLGFGLSINGKHIYCGDYIFSGHTVTLTFFYLFLREYLIPKPTCRTFAWSAFNFALFSSSVLGVLFILIARAHYTIDVIIAYFITITTFYVYHTLVHNKSLRDASPKHYLTRFWWWPLMKYLEYGHIQCSITNSRTNTVCLRCEATSKVNTEVPRKFDWPLSWSDSEKRRSNSMQRLLSQP